MQNIVMFLQQYGISATTAVKVHNSLGANSVELIKKNPYILSDMVDGISFKTSDTIAFNMGLPKTALCVYVRELYIFYAVPHIQAVMYICRKMY